MSSTAYPAIYLSASSCLLVTRIVPMRGTSDRLQMTACQLQQFFGSCRTTGRNSGGIVLKPSTPTKRTACSSTVRRQGHYLNGSRFGTLKARLRQQQIGTVTIPLHMKL